MSISFNTHEALSVLQKYWNYPDFRPKQRKVIEALSEGNHVIALLPTGGGKSLCYQVPALVRSGVTIVVSPLISLMEDQVDQLKSIHVKADAVHSGQSKKDIDRILDNCIYGDTKLLYVSPERLSHSLFIERVNRMKISLLAIDEAHCLSQWGHDFRPSYLKIKEFLNTFEIPQIIALTATATSAVIEELKTHLFPQSSVLIKGSFRRDNIKISVEETEDKIGGLIDGINVEGKTIIYVRSRRKVQMITKTLQNHRVKAAYYHAGLDYKEKQSIQQQFKKGAIQVIAATNAFGMGIDVSDVRSVIHYDIPPSIEEYYQEIGRAGRDGKGSEAKLMQSKDDVKFMNKRITEEFPSFEFCQDIYKKVHVHYGIGIQEGEGRLVSCDLKKLSSSFNISARKLLNAIQLWQRLGIWELSSDSKPRLLIMMTIQQKERTSYIQSKTLGAELTEHFLRNCENAFSQWVHVDVARIQKRFKLNQEELSMALSNLKSDGVLKYFYLPAGERLLFVEPRNSVKYLTHYQKKFEFLKRMKLERNNSILSFLSSTTCRMNYILEYFDEEVSALCGMCDRCNYTDNQSQYMELLEKQRAINEDFD